MIKFLRYAFLLFTLTMGTTFAANIPFEQSNFDQLLKQGKSVVLHIHADWCPTCKAQQNVLDELMTTAEFKELPVLRADFDKETKLLRKLKVRNQSTFIVFKNGKEITRSTGETDKASIANLLKQAL
jgi:thiol:disulfide interchange protein